MTSALKDLEVDRSDAVDEPATGRKWLVLKTEDPDELEANLQELADHAAGAIEALQKGAVALDRLSQKKLERLVKMLGPKHFKGTFTLRKAEDEKDAAGEKPAAGAAEATTPSKDISLSKDSLETLKGFTGAVGDLKTTVEKYFAAGPEEEEEEPEEDGQTKRGLKKGRKDEDPESSQLEAGRRVKKTAPKLGEGLFQNIVYGED